MTQTIQIELTETQFKGLEYAALSPQEWAENAVTERARIANDEIVQLTVQHCLDNGIQVPATREAIVTYAFDNDVVKTVAVRQAEVEAQAAEMAPAEGEQQMSKTRDLANLADLNFDSGTMVVDKVNDKVGIGTSSPQQLLSLKANNPGGKIRLEMGQTGVANNDVTGEIQFYHNDASGAGVNADIKGICTSSVGAGALTFGTGTTSTTERMRIDSSGNVGIGTTSPSSYNSIMNDLVVAGSSDSGITIASGTANEGSIAFADGTAGADAYRGWINYNHNSNFMRFFSNATERLRIDTSGNVLVGTTTADGGYDESDGGATTTFIGASIGGAASGTAFVSRRAAPLQLNRQANDGDIVEFRKDGTTVGSIGTSTSYSGQMAINASSSNLIINANGSDYAFDSTQFYPLTAGRNLGLSSNQFGNLYLSGGVYLGGTGSANLLDDYEIGTWNPSFILSSGTATGVAYGRYIKVGQLVYVTFYLQITSGSGTIDYITNLPFASENSGSWAAAGIVRETAQTGYQWHTYVYPNQNYMLFRRYDNTNGFAVNYTWSGSVTYTTP